MGRKAGGKNYRGTDVWKQDDRTGFVVRTSQTRREWTGILVDEKVWEPRQPQDLVRGVSDNQTVRDARPVATPVFDGPIYIALNASAAIGATFISLGSIAGLTVGDSIGVMLDNGVLFGATIQSISSTGVTILAPGLPWPATKGNMLVDYQG